MSLKNIIAQRLEKCYNIDVNQIINEDRTCLHDPLLYDSMASLIELLHAFKLHQDKNPSALLVVDTDYDTDGIASAAVLSAALNVFGIRYKVYIPTMAHGYGLNPQAVEEMCQLFNVNGDHVAFILTADNGTNAVSGVQAALDRGIQVAVTDHHIGGDDVAPAQVIVNPNKTKPRVDNYPFKGNAGATVAWKAMQAYAQRYQPESQQLIDDLIVFAGIANVSDVMPIVDENHYMVKEALVIIRRLISYQPLADPYRLMSTGYPHYDAVFHGLFDILKLLQASKDEERRSMGKKPIPLTDNEELISWYLSPLFNAPRRVHETSYEAMVALLSTDPNLRQTTIKTLIEMNREKSRLRNKVLDAIKSNNAPVSGEHSRVVFANTRSGIAGLIAGHICGNNGLATIVFAHLDENSKEILYASPQDPELVISGSARSTNSQPLDRIIDLVRQRHPELVIKGGGHALAAGYSIKAGDLDAFCSAFDQAAKDVADIIAKELEAQIASGQAPVAFDNCIKFTTHDEAPNTKYACFNYRVNDLQEQIQEAYYFIESLRPFGRDFKEPTFIFSFCTGELWHYDLNLDFWHTFKFTYQDVTFLTFNIKLANKVKEAIASEEDLVVTTTAKIKSYTYRGKTSYQIIFE